MEKAKQEIAEVCRKLSGAALDAELDSNIEGRINNILDAVSAQKMIVPVIGAFSAGKSSMLNTLTGRQVLPEAITPETSIATELYYTAGDEYAEGITPDNNSVKYSIDKMHDLAANAAQYQYARCFLNSPQLKELEPLVLVDMPGFNSPLDQHNKAILNYLNRGCYYVVLSSVEEGTLSSSLIRRLNEIDTVGRKFSVFLSKANLRSSQVVQELQHYYEQQLYDTYDIRVPVKALNNKSASEVAACLKGIDTDALVRELYRNSLLEICQSIIEGLNIQIVASQRNMESIRYAQEEMENSIRTLRQKADADIASMRQRYSSVLVNDLITAVSSGLENSIDEFIESAMRGDRHDLEQRMNEVIRSVLLPALKQKVADINHDIVMDFSSSLEHLDEVMKTSGIMDSYIKDFTDSLQSMFVNSLSDFSIQPQQFQASLQKLSSSAGFNIGSKVVGTAAGITGLVSSVLSPVVGIVIFMLPEIINGLISLFTGGKNSQEQKKRDSIEECLRNRIFPQIKTQLRRELPGILDSEIQQMIQQVQAQYEQRISAQQAELQKAAQSQSLSQEEAYNRKQKLEAARISVQSVSAEISKWR